MSRHLLFLFTAIIPFALAQRVAPSVGRSNWNEGSNYNSSRTQGQGFKKVRVSLFPSPTQMGFYVAEARGFFQQDGIDLEIIPTTNSEDQRQGLTRGRFDIAVSPIDNAVALEEATKLGVISVMSVGGGGQLFLYAQPEIHSISELRGKTVLVDARDTAFALLMYQMLKLNGLTRDKDYNVLAVGGTPLRFAAMTKNKDNAAALLNNPVAFIATQRGFTNLGRAQDIAGPYQADVAFVLNQWAKANAEVLVSFIRAYVEGLHWVLDASHKDEVIDLIAKKFDLSADVATKSYESIIDPTYGVSRDGNINLRGFQNVMKLRAEFEGRRDGTAEPLQKYYDLRYYNLALKRNSK